jgi:hypothetical protein
MLDRGRARQRQRRRRRHREAVRDVDFGATARARLTRGARGSNRSRPRLGISRIDDEDGCRVSLRGAPSPGVDPPHFHARGDVARPTRALVDIFTVTDPARRTPSIRPRVASERREVRPRAALDPRVPCIN